MSENNPQITHTWEATKADANWASINEDEDGNIIASSAFEGLSLADQIRLRRKRLAKLDHAQSSKRILRDMIRYLYLVLDLSEAVYEKDAGLGFGPNKTRLDVVLQLAEAFANEYYDQNPLSHLGIIICKNGEAQVLSLLTGSKRSTATAIGALREGVASGLVGAAGKDAGEFSLQNGIEVAGRSLGHMPQHGSREILVMVGALSTCDPGDVLVDTLPRLLGAGIRVNCLAMCAEMHICRKLSESTGGVMGVGLDGNHLKDLLMNFIAPPPALKHATSRGGINSCEFVAMGFPKRVTEPVPTLIHTVSSTGSGSVTRENKLFFGRTAYECPRCKAKASELPCDCAVCGLKLVLAPHLARSFHHLFPVPPFEEVLASTELTSRTLTKQHIEETKSSSVLPEVASSSTYYSFDPPAKLGYKMNTETKEVQIDSSLFFSSKDCDRVCFGCLKKIGLHEIIEKRRRNGKASSGIGGANKEQLSDGAAESLRFQCPDCKNIFCSDCDEYLHETLHNCPGCLSK